MRTLGIDLSSQPKDTAVCLINWPTDSGEAKIERWKTGWTDDELVEFIEDSAAEKIGIDAPFGWPIEYVTALAAYRDFGIWPVADEKTLRFRATERNLGAGLSPSLDNLVWTTLRCARLLDRCATDAAIGVERTGEGRFVEVYPAAALKRWGLSPASSGSPGGYKKDDPASIARRQKLVADLARELQPVLDLPEDFVSACGEKAGDHLVDALVSSLSARAMAANRCDPIPPGAQHRAEREGWIRVPTGPLREDAAAFAPV